MNSNTLNPQQKNAKEQTEKNLSGSHDQWNALSLPNAKPWESSSFEAEEQDPLTGFANIMDVMLVFALGLMVALLSTDRSSSSLITQKQVNVQQGEELIEVPDSIQQALNSDANGMESLGQVYRDPETGKLILIGQ